MEQLGADIENAIRLYENTVATYPPEQAFGTNDDIAKSCWANVYPAMRSGREIMEAFRGVLTTIGQDTGAVGGVFSHADHGATVAAQSSDTHTHH